METLIDRPFTAETFAIAVHSGQSYGDKLYSYHLQKVVAITKQYTEQGEIISAAWLHDVIEDTGVSYWELCRRFGQPIANIVWACTGVGANRKERQASIALKLPIYPGAPLVKLADRIANIEEGGKREMYRKESEHFLSVVRPYVSEAMLEHYERAIND